MALTIKAASYLRRYMPNQNTEMIVDCAPASTVADVTTALGLLPEKIGLVRVNGRQVGTDQVLNDGDVVELFPRIGGG